MMRWASLGIAAILGASSIGCAAGRRFAASPEEYAVYRSARASKTLEERLTASQKYTVQYPEGAWSDEMRAFFAKAEPLYFQGAKGSATMLEKYLAALPHGPNAKEAALRLRDLRAAESADRTAFTGTAQATEETVAHEAERRKAVGERIGTWLALFLDPQVFARPLVDSKVPLIVPWSLGLPWPICSRPAEGDDSPKAPAGAVRRCTKLLQLDYRAVDDGVAAERQALVEIAVWQDESGRPVEVSIGGPELFLRLLEATTARAAEANDPESKLHGAEQAVELAQETFRSVVGGDKTCKKPSDADVLRLVCKGLTLRVLAGALDGEDDRFVVRAP